MVAADVTDPDQVAAAVEFAAGADGLDICVANAGVSLMEDLLDGTLESWERVLRVNLVGVMVTLKEAARSMVQSGNGGRLLGDRSVAGLHGEAGGSAYCASKAGVIGLVKTLAIELAPARITVNAVAPGQIDTAMSARDPAMGRGEGDAASQLSCVSTWTGACRRAGWGRRTRSRGCSPSSRPTRPPLSPARS